MMGIKIIVFRLIALLLMFIICAEQVSAQKIKKYPATRYLPVDVKVSHDNKYLTFQKNHEYRSDTLVLLSVAWPEQILYQMGGTNPDSLHFLPDEFLYVNTGSVANLLHIPTLTVKKWENAKKAFYSVRHQRICILRNNTLEIYDSHGKLLSAIEEVITVEEQAQRILYTVKENNNYHLMEWMPGKVVRLFSADRPNFQVFYATQKELIIQLQEENKELALFYVGKSGDPTPVSIKEIPRTSNLAAASAVGSDKILLTLSVPDEQPDLGSTVDIWYPNDRQLEKKILPAEKLVSLIFKSDSGHSTLLDHASFAYHTAIGNSRYLLALNPHQNRDYTRDYIQQPVFRYDTKTATYKNLGVAGLIAYSSLDGKYLLSHDTANWVLFDINSGTRRVIQYERETVPYFSDNGKQILFFGTGNISAYDLRTGRLHATKLPAGFVAEALGGNRITIPLQKFMSWTSYDQDLPLILRIQHPETTQQALGTYQQNAFSVLTSVGLEQFSPVSADLKNKTYFYTVADYNRPPELYIHQQGNTRKVFQTNKDDKDISHYRMQRISYTNSKSVPLTGLLYYPLHHQASQKYPMIVGIYEKLRFKANHYLRDGFAGVVEGFNIRSYLDEGYFVYLPDIVYDSRGTGWSALDCVESAMDALKNKPSVDLTKVGLIGHSHGGYETNFIATQSPRFAAFVAGAGNSDLVRSYHSFNYNFLSPFFWQFEDRQYRMFTSFADNKELYISNSPVYHAEKVNKPILLWTGMLDQNIDWNQTMEFYLALRRNHKEVIALFYKDEEHSFLDIKNRADLFNRIAQWFDHHLKGYTRDWISDMNK
ncbi:prolyl oligopeptidase family serine peptidase [Chryseobacterium salipaludis]|uniref:alpha/beta hydrolase family protein n=1 Tax=Chryseobacterium TaxID=59732 RepID=UPI001FF63865|nr:MULTISPECIES: prolyl oligopeptidase family serine peptidase [Chryseobacterium]MCJ8498615.1 prolyl oligopeptidase family serine peptidase [Chryseobacterium salipaludis]MCX3297735.1 prolyl oligopeptidase family serine peptidase [Planobacterium sp. JC490]